MPTYEYQCQKCGDLFEVRQKFVDAPLTTHENCGGTVHRLLSAPALQFKGSGWYITDYAKGSGAGSNGSATADSSAKGESKDTGEKSEIKNAGSSEKSSTPSSSETKTG